MGLRIKVRQLAEQRGLNMSRLQRRADVAMNTVRRYWYNTADGKEDGQPLTVADLESLNRIAAALGVKPSELFEDVPADELQAA